MAADAFISYSSKDDEFAKELKRRLEGLKRRRMCIWRDKEDLSSGEPWARGIDNALREVALVILVVSPDSMKSAYVTYEWRYTRFELDKELHPIILRQCDDNDGVYGRLKSLQVPPEALNYPLTEADWDKLVMDVERRFKGLSEVNEAAKRLLVSGSERDALRPNGRLQEHLKKAANDLGNVEYYKSKARDYLHEGIRVLLSDEDGEAMIAIARALDKVGDLKSIPFLWEAYKSSQIQTYDKSAIETLSGVISRLSQQSIKT